MNWETIVCVAKRQIDMIPSILFIIGNLYFVWCIWSLSFPCKVQPDNVSEPEDIVTEPKKESKSIIPEPKKVYKIEMPELSKAPEKVIPHRSYNDRKTVEKKDERLDRWRDEAAERRLRKRRERDRQYWGY